jgi:LuxR family maltose regulon positive regulatory protein
MEPQPILPTKLYIPASRPETVIRQHLLKLINDNFLLKTILVAAPAGFGKTTLIWNWSCPSCHLSKSNWIILTKTHK